MSVTPHTSDPIGGQLAAPAPPGTSLWAPTVGPPPERAALPGDVDVDVSIVGAGYTGLWTAFYLRRADPTLRIAILERAHAGFGASGRNGGWCSAIFPVGPRKLARMHGEGPATALRMALQESVDEVGAVAETEGMSIDYAKGGAVTLIRNPAQLQRARDELQTARRFGVAEADLRMLGGDEARRLVGAEGVLGATYSPHCAALHPGRLVRQLAERVEAAGVSIYERTTVRSIGRGIVETDRGRVRAGIVVRATEGYTAQLSGFRHALVPIYSLMIATEPLPGEVWDQIGLHGRPTFTDHRFLRIYGQRTADDRLAFGGRGAPYHFASTIRNRFDVDDRIHDGLRTLLGELFPAVAGRTITHRWGGPLAIARDWHPSVGIDRAAGLAWGGGYVGDGVSTANLAGRTLADLVLERHTPLTELPWVNHRARRWEPEPLRWLGVNAGLQLVSTADRAEARTGRPARRARAIAHLLGY